MSLLILGGTSDAKRLTNKLIDAGLDVTYSIAGKVRQPNLECKVLTGGIQANGGWQELLASGRFSAVVDATHPYAARISAQAKQACEQHQIPYHHYCRPAWQPETVDNWTDCNSWQQIVEQLHSFQRPFITLGQLSKLQLEQIPTTTFLRSARLPGYAMPMHCQWLPQIGPFSLEQELALMKGQKFDVLVCKNSGGKAVQNKLIAARELGIPVLMLARPEPVAEKHFSCVNHCADELIKDFSGWRNNISATHEVQVVYQSTVTRRERVSKLQGCTCAVSTGE